MTVSYPLPSGGDYIANAVEWKAFIEELKRQWRLLWRERIDDKARAEGIASTDFELLFVDRGTVIVATRSFKPLNFKKIMEQYETPYEVKAQQETPSPQVGGWRKFGKKIAAMRREGEGRSREAWFKDDSKGGRKQGLQLKQGGRGWLHIKAK